jgi:arylsulfatase A-like enzyme
MKKPNIVFFFTDDQRFDTIAALGNSQIRTPNIDKLVERGTSFTHAHIPCGTSGAVCMPSRAMLNTGRSLFHIEGCGKSIPEEHTTIGECLQSAGYRTFGTGKWHNGNAAYHRSFTDGDEIFFGGMADHWNVPAYHFDPTGKYETTIKRCPDAFHGNKTEIIHCDHIDAGHHSSELVCGAAIDFIKNYDSEAPFYTYISFLAPHDPRTMPEEFRKMYDAEDIDLPPNFMGGHPFDTGALHIRDEELAAFPRDPEETRRHLAEYYAMISHLDHQLGNVVKAVEEKGELENTIFVFAGDNGLALGQHGLFGKQNCYDHSVRVPLIFAGPGVPQGEKSDSFVYLFDIFATICELANIAIPETVEGKSMVSAMNNTSLKVRDTLYFAYCQFQRAVRDSQFKLIEYVIDSKHIKTQLFDAENDPWELANLADNPDYKDKICELRKELIRYSHDWNDRDSEFGTTFWKGYERN